MRPTRAGSQKLFGALVILSGGMGIAVAILATPTFATKYLSQDHSLSGSGIEQLNTYRAILAAAGLLFIVGGLTISLVRDLQERLQRVAAAFAAWLPPRALKPVLFVVILALFAARFVSLDADFPSGITKSAELYTDEGWFAAGAARQILTGQWYLAGDINKVVPMPAGQVLQRISFALLGLSLSSARATIVLSYLLLTVFASLLVRRQFGDYAALLAALLLASNFVGFAYSRLATADLIATCFMVGCLLVASRARAEGMTVRFLGASMLLGIGILAKTSAAFAAALVALLAWRQASSPKERVALLAVSALAILALAGGYLALTFRAFPEDYLLHEPFGPGLFYTNLRDWYLHLGDAVALTQRLGAAFVNSAALVTLSALVISKRYRSDLIVQVLLAYVGIYLLMISVDAYRPVRYYLPLLVPIAGLFAAACIALVARLRETPWAPTAVLPVILVGVVSIAGIWRTVDYLAAPSFSFYQMARQVGDIIRQREGTDHGVLLFGDIADSVSLEIGTNSANTLLGIDQLAQMRRYHPKYMIVHTSHIDQLAASEGARVQQLGAWDVFGNYYANGEQVRLYLAQWPGQN